MNRVQRVVQHMSTPIPAATQLLKRGARAFSSTSTLLETEIKGKVAIIRLNDPSHMNALTCAMGDAFTKEIDRLKEKAARQEIRAAVLIGNGKAFSAGGDLAWLRERHSATPFCNNMTMIDFYNRFLCIRHLQVPTIAAINGAAVGAGLAVALACDMRVAAKTAMMGLTFTKLGIHPGMGSSLLLPRVVGQQHATHMLLSGKLVDGLRAKEIGLVMETVETADQTEERAMELACEVANNAPMSVRSCLVTLRNQKFHGLDAALEREASEQATNYQGQDFIRGLDALASRAAPEFQGW